jgi:beta-carotene 3-hydroxylase
MHGLLWSWHEDHHRPLRKGLQKNDRFVLVFSLFNASLYISGSLLSFPTLIWIAAGVTLYGIGYFLFHDVMFHNRLPWMKLKPTTRYLRRIVKAHSVHHQNSGKNNGISFGFLYAPPKYDVG